MTTYKVSYYDKNERKCFTFEFLEEFVAEAYKLFNYSRKQKERSDVTLKIERG